MKIDFERLLSNKLMCDACSAREEASKVVLPVYTPSRVWFLGRNPGRSEDVEGTPFVGRGGKRLDSWIERLGYVRSNFLIENVLACYTENDRQPTREEIASCSFWLKKEMELLTPALVICLGNDAFHLMMSDFSLSVVKQHGVELTGVFFPCKVFPMEHPGRSLRSSFIEKQVVEYDLPRLREVLKNYEDVMAW